MLLNVIGSSSSGNSYILQNDKEALVIECGCKFIDIKRTLKFNLSKVVGCLVSHKHMDHCLSSKELLQSQIDIYTNGETVDFLSKYDTKYLHEVEEKKQFIIGNFKVTPFSLPHDDVECFGYKVFHEEIGNLLFLTDFHYCKYKFKNISHLLVEANWSKEFIGYSINKEHILKGHAELETTLEFIKTTDNNTLLNVVLLHLSDSNSSADMFYQKTKNIVKNANVYVAEKGLSIELSTNPF